ncbi:beta-propeller domain-containing protein [Lutispora sp.]|uniref:beta-propeller domain-containing protein n=1 Tax=Lutispora sp. TaxID=2828727 RepID=UPI00356256B1
MHDNGKLMRNAMIFMLIVSMVLCSIAFAKEETYNELPAVKAFYTNEVLEVPFDEPLAANSINRDNIYVKNSKGAKIPIDRNISKDGKTIVIKPMTEYIRGETYTLYINKNVKYRNGNSIGQNLKMNFTIMEQIPVELPTVDTAENLENLMKEAGLDQEPDYAVGIGGEIIRGSFDTAATKKLAEAATAAPSGVTSVSAEATSSQADYSTTNVQVQGVDEADVVKTDGEYLYQVNNSRIVIAKIYPSNEMKIVKIINMDEENLYPLELYVDQQRLVVIGHSNNSIPIMRPMTIDARISIYPPRYSYTTVKLIEYDIMDKKNITKTREIELEGAYVSSRKIEDKLYLVSGKRFNYYHIMRTSQENYTPSYKDSALGDEFINIPYDKIAYFPNCISANYLIVAGVDLGNPKEGVNVSTYLGGGQDIYASAENLYVALIRREEKPDYPLIHDSANPQKEYDNYRDKETIVYRFAMNEGKLICTGKGIVPGEILNQFSMDEHNEHFRIATTKGEIWRDDEHTSKNNLYVLDKDMKIVGSIEDIAPGEKIYSVRFMGDKAYMVTFKTVDPLFVIDLKDPKAPKILGALKIPGYSDYLHPYDENHIIGFGKDTVEVVHKDIHGNERGTTAYYLGMKIAMFDVSDVANPKELFTEKIGDRGTTSELLNNHKALLFSKERNLMAFPVTVMEVNEADKGISQNQVPQYGQFTFQGAYVYNIDLTEGFKLKGKITHITDDEYMKSGAYWYDNSKNVERILYINDDLYTISKGLIKANDINSLNLKGQLEIP